MIPNRIGVFGDEGVELNVDFQYSLAHLFLYMNRANMCDFETIAHTFDHGDKLRHLLAIILQPAYAGSIKSSIVLSDPYICFRLFIVLKHCFQNKIYKFGIMCRDVTCRCVCITDVANPAYDNNY